MCIVGMINAYNTITIHTGYIYKGKLERCVFRIQTSKFLDFLCDLDQDFKRGERCKGNRNFFLREFANRFGYTTSFTRRVLCSITF